VSSGLGQATSSGGSSGGGGAPIERDHRWDDGRYHRDHHDSYLYIEPGVTTTVGTAGTPPSSQPPRDVRVDFYAGAQKVHESDGSLSLDLAFNEGRFRLGGSLSRYYERQPEHSALTFTLASLYLGVRVDDGGATRVHLEAGAVGATTNNDPVMDSSVGGFLGGVRVEHRVSRGLALIGDAQAMVFEQDVRAGAVRAGVRVGHFQAALRYLDLNVGPALFGPEIGLSF
jgi:hypothetical protein